jgi:hypothetical protein
MHCRWRPELAASSLVCTEEKIDRQQSRINGKTDTKLAASEAARPLLSIDNIPTTCHGSRSGNGSSNLDGSREGKKLKQKLWPTIKKQ